MAPDDLAGAFAGQPPVVALARLLRHGFEIDVPLLDESCTVVARRPGGGDLWCDTGSIQDPVSGFVRIRETDMVIAAHLDEFLLDAWLHQAGVDAPVRLHAEAVSPEAAAVFLKPYAPISTSAATDGGPASGYYAGRDVLVLHLPSQGTLWPRPRLQIYAKNRPAARGAITDDLKHRSWHRVDGIYEPETDLVSPGWKQRDRVGTDDVSGESFQRALSAEDPVEALDRFLHAWYGLRLPVAAGVEVGPPRLLRSLHELNENHRVVGLEENLVPLGELRVVDGLTTFSTNAAYMSGAAGPAVFRLNPPDDEPADAGITLDEYLLAFVLNEAIAGSACHAMTTIEDPGLANEVLGHLGCVRPGAPKAIAIYATDEIIVHARTYEHRCRIRAAARHRAAIASSPLRTLGGWLWFRPRDSGGDVTQPA